MIHIFLLVDEHWLNGISIVNRSSFFFVLIVNTHQCYQNIDTLLSQIAEHFFHTVSLLSFICPTEKVSIQSLSHAFVVYSDICCPYVNEQ